jgi:hypothetical protein
MGTLDKAKKNIAVKVRVSPAVMSPPMLCKKCGAVAVSYYVQPMWTYPDNFQGKLPLFGYCAKHPQDVLNMVPKELRTAIRMVTEMSGRTGTHPEISSELILHKGGDEAIGSIAKKLMMDKSFPHEDDTQILSMAEKPAGTIFLVYSAKGKFEKKFRKHDEAVDYYDPKTQVIIYCGSNNFAGIKLLKVLKQK